jgi:hypothetical protein
MPPEQDDVRARQLEAMRQYFAELGVQRNSPIAQASASQPASATQRPATMTPRRAGGLGGVQDGGRPGQCDARLRREAAGGGGEQGRILRDPASRRLSGPQLLERVAPALRVGASESDRFGRGPADYRQVVDQCKLQAP